MNNQTVEGRKEAASVPQQSALSSAVCTFVADRTCRAPRRLFPRTLVQVVVAVAVMSEGNRTLPFRIGPKVTSALRKGVL